MLGGAGRVLLFGLVTCHLFPSILSAFRCDDDGNTHCATPYTGGGNCQLPPGCEKPEDWIKDPARCRLCKPDYTGERCHLFSPTCGTFPDVECGFDDATKETGFCFCPPGGRCEGLVCGQMTMGPDCQKATHESHHCDWTHGAALGYADDDQPSANKPPTKSLQCRCLPSMDKCGTCDYGWFGAQCAATCERAAGVTLLCNESPLIACNSNKCRCSTNPCKTKICNYGFGRNKRVPVSERTSDNVPCEPCFTAQPRATCGVPQQTCTDGDSSICSCDSQDYKDGQVPKKCRVCPMPMYGVTCTMYCNCGPDAWCDNDNGTCTCPEEKPDCQVCADGYVLSEKGLCKEEVKEEKAISDSLFWIIIALGSLLLCCLVMCLILSIVFRQRVKKWTDPFFKPNKGGKQPVKVLETRKESARDVVVRLPDGQQVVTKIGSPRGSKVETGGGTAESGSRDGGETTGSQNRPVSNEAPK